MGAKAFGIQKPDKLWQKYIILRGPEGAFKGLSAHDSYGKIFGLHYRYMSAGQMNPSFNKFLEGVIVMFADEAIYAGDNMMKIIQATNERYVVPTGGKGKNARRPVIFDVVPLIPPGHEFFGEYVAALENGLLGEILGFLKQWDISKFNILKTPLECMEAVNEQKLRGMDPVYSWWHSVLVNGEIQLDPNSEFAIKNFFVKISEKETTKAFRKDLLASFRKHGLRTTYVKDHDFWMTMADLSPAFKITKNNGGRFHELPPLQTLRQQFCDALGVQMGDAFQDDLSTAV